uniref:Geranylgeranyl transferase type-2 subunit alpha n=1 Tax=Heterorhabditis bacteriophora TaxID=37862 RepID=A0A1I7X9Q1_HETBA
MTARVLNGAFIDDPENPRRVYYCQPKRIPSLDEMLTFCAAERTMAKTLAISFDNGSLKDRYIRPDDQVRQPPVYCKPFCVSDHPRSVACALLKRAVQKGRGLRVVAVPFGGFQIQSLCYDFTIACSAAVHSMHFVKKIPTSDDEKAIKEKERSAKLKLFCTTRNKIFEKRNKGELDDEILTLTYKLLEKNPDIYTFWNIRRETIEKKITEWKNEQDRSNDDKYKVDCQQNIDSILNPELLLTQLCLELLRLFLPIRMIKVRGYTVDGCWKWGLINTGFSSLCSNPQSSRIWQFLSNSPLEVQPDQTKIGEWIDISKTPYVNKDLLRKAFDITIRPASLAISTITENCHQLIKLEPTNMIYKHLASRQILNSALRTKDEDGVTILDNILNGKEKRLVLRNRDIISLDGIELLAGLITDLDASGNKLKCLDDILLPNLEFLTVNENPIKW